MFGQQSVQGHGQFITEMEKYSRKGQVKSSADAILNPKSDLKMKPKVDIHVGLSKLNSSLNLNDVYKCSDDKISGAKVYMLAYNYSRLLRFAVCFTTLLTGTFGNLEVFNVIKNFFEDVTAEAYADIQVC